MNSFTKTIKKTTAVLLFFAVVAFAGNKASAAGLTGNFYYTISGTQVSFYDSTNVDSTGHWTWTFGDGGSSSQTNPVHTYVGGTYTVTLMVYDSSYTNSDTVTKSITVGAMTYVSSIATQNFTKMVAPGSTNQRIIGIEVEMSSTGSPVKMEQFNLKTNGSTNVTSDVSTAKIYYTGNSNKFSLVTQVGSNNTPSGKFAISGSQNLLNGTNYFWVTYDITSGATTNNMVDVEADSISIGGVKYPISNSNPGSGRQIGYCGADFSYFGPIGSKIFFTNKSAASSGAKYSWDFGDGNTSTQASPSHTYAASGTYYVCLVQTDTGFGCKDTICDSVAVYPITYISSQATQNNLSKVAKGTTNAEILGLEVEMSSGNSMIWIDTLTFSTSGTNNPTTNITNAKVFYTGNSSTFTTTTQEFYTITNPNGTMNFIGKADLLPGTNYFWLTYDIKAGANTNDSVDAIAKVIVMGGLHYPSITDPAGKRPIAASCGQASFNQSISGLQVTLTNTTGWKNTLHTWTFGDGNGSSQSSPTHTYASAGTYTVCLVENDTLGGCIDTLCKSITVAAPMTYISSTATQNNTSLVYPGNSTANIIGVEIEMSSTGSSTVPLEILWFDMKGTNNSGTNVRNAKVYSTGNSSSFATTTTFGSTVSSPNGKFAMTGNQPLKNGTNYFWLAYDVSNSATWGDTLDAAIDSIVLNKTVYVPSITSPAGYRIIGTCPSASFGYKPTGLQVDFTNSKSQWSTVKHQWSFGDGNTSTQKSPTHTYAASGNYTVCLIENDTMFSCSDTFCSQVSVTKPTCTASFTDSILSMDAWFTNTSSTINSSTATYTWNYGDSTGDTTVDGAHRYTSNGTYTVCLTISDKGCSDTYCKQVTIGSSSSCSAKYSYSANQKTVTFTNQSTGTNGSTTYTYDFGDGNSSSSQNPSHTYASFGTYTACLYISDSAGCQDTMCQSITISNQYTVAGTIYMGNGATVADEGKVWAIHYDSTAGTLTAIDSVTIDSSRSGKYSFNLNPGYYLVKAALRNASGSYSSYMPTYYNDKLHWDTANLITLTANQSGVDIHLIAGNNPGGPGFIGGYTSQGANKTSSVGDPIPGVEIILLDNAKKPVAYTYSDANGKYSFSNLPYGTYEISPEILGKANFDLSVTISASQPSVSNIVVEVNTKYATVAFATGISQPTSSIPFAIYPNPANSTLNIELEGNTSFITTVTDMQGRSTGLTALQEGNKMKLDVSSLASGMYILNLTAKDGSNYKQRFVKE